MCMCIQMCVASLCLLVVCQISCGGARDHPRARNDRVWLLPWRRWWVWGGKGNTCAVLCVGKGGKTHETACAHVLLHRGMEVEARPPSAMAHFRRGALFLGLRWWWYQGSLCLGEDTTLVGTFATFATEKKEGGVKALKFEKKGRRPPLWRLFSPPPTASRCDAVR